MVTLHELIGIAARAGKTITESNKFILPKEGEEMFVQRGAGDTYHKVEISSDGEPYYWGVDRYGDTALMKLFNFWKSEKGQNYHWYTYAILS